MTATVALRGRRAEVCDSIDEKLRDASTYGRDCHGASYWLDITQNWSYLRYLPLFKGRQAQFVLPGGQDPGQNGASN